MEEKYFSSMEEQTQILENRFDIVESESDAIIVASYGVFSVGVNIRNLHNIIFASPSKSRIRNLQSIGRGLRLSDKKEIALYMILRMIYRIKKRKTTLWSILRKE